MFWLGMMGAIFFGQLQGSNPKKLDMPMKNASEVVTLYVDQVSSSLYRVEVNVTETKGNGN